MWDQVGPKSLTSRQIKLREISVSNTCCTSHPFPQISFNFNRFHQVADDWLNNAKFNAWKDNPRNALVTWHLTKLRSQESVTPFQPPKNLDNICHQPLKLLYVSQGTHGRNNILIGRHTNATTSQPRIIMIRLPTLEIGCKSSTSSRLRKYIFPSICQLKKVQHLAKETPCSLPLVQ